MSNSVQRGLARVPDLLRLAARHPDRYPCLFASTAPGGPQARWDLLLAFPQATLTRDAVRGVCRDGRPLGHADFLAELDRAWGAERRAQTDDGLPFHGGWALFLGYELAASIEPRLRLPEPAPGLPQAMALRCPAAVLVDRARGRAVLVAEPEHAALLERMAADIRDLSDAPAERRLPACRVHEDPPERFVDAVERAREYIAAGDVFQVNLARRWQARFAVTPAAGTVFAALRAVNPAPFAALWQQPDWAIISASPERLIEARGRRIQTRPIAGTRPRGEGSADADLSRELLAHPKERAEHVMLIDLERNDIGRVCEPGSVEVDEFMVLESHPHVHHIVSNVRGTRRTDVTPGQLIAACFPGGTITGCPKVRCMEIIAELEGRGRGPYTGAVGYLDRSGDMDLNILIRSFVERGASLSLHAGAGIVHDSVAALELAETRAKAHGLLRALTP